MAEPATTNCDKQFMGPNVNAPTPLKSHTGPGRPFHIHHGMLYLGKTGAYTKPLECDDGTRVVLLVAPCIGTQLSENYDNMPKTGRHMFSQKQNPNMKRYACNNARVIAIIAIDGTRLVNAVIDGVDYHYGITIQNVQVYSSLMRSLTSIEHVSRPQFHLTCYYDNGFPRKYCTFREGHREVGEIYEWDDRGRFVRCYVNSTRGYKHGPCVEYDEDTNTVVETQYVNGTEHGTRKKFVDDVLQVSMPITYGQIDGVVTTYYPNGQIMRTTEYKQDAIDGIENEYDSDGFAIKVTNYKNGRKHGNSTTYINRLPIVMSEYVNGKLHGLTYMFNETGMIIQIVNYNNGRITWAANYCNNKKYGPSVEFYGNGKIKRMVEFRDNNKHGPEYYYDIHGIVIKVMKYDMNVIMSATYYRDGVMTHHRELRDGVKIMELVCHKDGTIKLHITYSADNVIKRLARYDKDGTLVQWNTDQTAYMSDGTIAGPFTAATLFCPSTIWSA